MSLGFFKVPDPENESVYTYAPGTAERLKLKDAIATARSSVIDIPMIINGKEIRTDRTIPIFPPHDLHHLLGNYHRGNTGHVQSAIKAAMKAKKAWADLSWEIRASIFLKAAALLAGKYRYRMNAATMIGQSKNPLQAEIDSACELIDFFRFNVKFMSEIYSQQPRSIQNIWNRQEMRPLEGFIFALTPFNFTSIAGNLPTAPAIMGNTVVWKPSNSQIYSARLIMELLMEAGLPDGVINLVFVSGPEAGNVIFSHPDFGGIHYTGSTKVFQGIWKSIGSNIDVYKTYPRIVGETGGKDFIMVHSSVDIDLLITALVRGAFEYQGQKCSAVSRVYIPESIWPEIRLKLENTLKEIRPGPPENFRNFFNAVIDESSFDSLSAYIEQARKDKDAEVIIGGGYDKSVGYFIDPTVILTKNPDYITMQEELFGPVLSVFVYQDHKYHDTLKLVNNTSVYALTGSIFAQDRFAIETALTELRDAAGNFYINDKPTGAVVGQQPFGGARRSGTNDKAGSVLNLYRWVSSRIIKENYQPPRDYKYLFMQDE
jgi:1-pyrroline-5-carboxylate dehydrogenase